jgi:hypothetical protein
MTAAREHVAIFITAEGLAALLRGEQLSWRIEGERLVTAKLASNVEIDATLAPLVARAKEERK